MDAFTRCDVCEMSPADTLYDGSPMCYDCRAATAAAKKETEAMPKEPCLGCGADVCEDIMCQYDDMGQVDSEDESDREARLQDEWEAYCLARVAPFND